MNAILKSTPDPMQDALDALAAAHAAVVEPQRLTAESAQRVERAKAAHADAEAAHNAVLAEFEALEKKHAKKVQTWLMADARTESPKMPDTVELESRIRNARAELNVLAASVAKFLESHAEAEKNVEAALANVRIAAVHVVHIESETLAQEIVQFETAAVARREKLCALIHSADSQIYGQGKAMSGAAVSPSARQVLDPPELGSQNLRFYYEFCQERGPHVNRIHALQGAWLKRFAELTSNVTK
jgi:hypothetical protein